MKTIHLPTLFEKECSSSCASLLKHGSTDDDQERDSTEKSDQRYDVFLSFRGKDTRLGFTAHLHKALKEDGFETFYDDEEIETGEPLKHMLVNAIKASRASVVILSENYATSTWCLDELVLILQQRRNSKHIVFPIFFHVEPTDIRKQQKSFKNGIAKHIKKMDEETEVDKKMEWAQKIDKWKKALNEVAALKGHDATNRLEPEFIEEIVKHIHRRICVPLKSPPSLELIGMENSINFVTSWLKDGSKHRADILTIWGMGGIGKTSLAQYVYGLHCREYKSISLIENISSKCNKLNGLLDVQKQLYYDITKRSPIQDNSVYVYTSAIENALALRKVLLVLDDIDGPDQLDALLGKEGFHAGSKVIITTKCTSLTESCALFNPHVQPKHTKHSLQVLDKTASLQLLCLHAFKCENPEIGFEEVSDNILKYCDGHPLALKVLGRSLHNKDVAHWEDRIKLLKKEPYFDIHNVLKMSFEALESDNDKDLFKHIACFFIGQDRDFTEVILEACGINTISGITNLIDRCLLRIERGNKLMMHSLIQKMGRDEVRQESPYKPEKRSRLWLHEESLKVLEQKKGTRNIKGLIIGMKMFEKDTLFNLETDTLSNMGNLEILHLDNVQMNGSYEKFPQEIRWLRMHWFPLESIPSDIPMKNLVALDMSYSKIKSFDMSFDNRQRPGKRQKSYSKAKRLLGSLKILNLSYCEQLRSICGFCELPALENLDLTSCMSLIDVCQSIEQCDKLSYINLSYCNNFRMLQKTIDKLKGVNMLDLEGCNLNELPFETLDMESVKITNDNSINKTLPASSSATAVALPRDFMSLVTYLRSLVLKNNNLYTESFPVDWSGLSMLEDLYLDGNPLVSMPNWVRSLPRLQTLSMVNCRKLTSVKYPPSSLESAYFDGPLLREVLLNQEMTPMELSVGLWSSEEPLSLQIVEGMFEIQPIADVEETVICSLGWSNLEFIKERCIKTYKFKNEMEGSKTQIYYEFGIFSTFYDGKEMPKWIRLRNRGPSISVIVPSSPKNLLGLNICYVLFSKPVDHQLPLIKISNLTKNLTWIYKHYLNETEVNVGGEWVTFISHWMFGMNDMESGDHVTITVLENVYQDTKNCGVSFVYDGGSTEEKEKDALDYYKSWNHIIGGDLSSFQLTTGEYLLDCMAFWRIYGKSHYLSPPPPCIAKDASYKEDIMLFKAFSQRKSNIHVRAIEDVTK